jgi:hypothetical protein
MSIDPMTTLVLPKPAYNVLRRLTGESRPDVALSIALRDLVRLRLEAAQKTRRDFEQKYDMPFSRFDEQWQSDQIQGKYTQTVEQDYLTWEAAVTDINALQELAEWMA